MRTAETVSAMMCPVCKVGLSMSDRQGIEIDYCPQCRGIWLDRGELDKIIERSAAPAPAPSAAPVQPVQVQVQPQAPSNPWGNQGGQYHQPHGYHHKRRKSWLEEIFD